MSTVEQIREVRELLTDLIDDLIADDGDNLVLAYLEEAERTIEDALAAAKH